MSMRSFLGNMNGENGQTGALRTFSLDADTTLVEYHGGAVLEVDPGGATVTITLPANACGRGFFSEIQQVGSGTVQIRAAADTSIDSTAGATPNLTAAWTSARVRRREGGSWLVDGSI